VDVTVEGALDDVEELIAGTSNATIE